MKITVVGAGYVGFSLAVLLARAAEVRILEISEEKIRCINQGRSPIRDRELEEYLDRHQPGLGAGSDPAWAYSGADLVILALPTNYAAEQGSFDMSHLETALTQIAQQAPDAAVIIKSTVPIGFTRQMQDRFKEQCVLVSPEFLREGRAFYDNLYPSRIVVGCREEDSRSVQEAERFAGLMQRAALRKDVPVHIVETMEAEAIKLFSNTYLAMRVAFFNEIDTFAMMKNLNTRKIIDGVCMDPRIQNQYNNPSFGYGGYCLPKDTRQLLAEYEGVPSAMVAATVKANCLRKEVIARQVLERAPEVVGVYRLTTKAGGDNFRQSSVLDVIDMLLEQGIKVVIYEPLLETEEYMGCRVARNFEAFAAGADVILANRVDSRLSGVMEKVYTRDLYGNN